MPTSSVSCRRRSWFEVPRPDRLPCPVNRRWPARAAASALGEERPAEELGRMLVFVRALILVHLPQVGGELGLLIATAGHVRVRESPLPAKASARPAACPRWAGTTSCASPAGADRRTWSASGPCASGRLPPPASAADTAFSSRSMESRARTASLLLNCSVMRPAVAHFAQFADDAPLGVAQRVLEDRVPLVPNQRQKNLGIVQILRLRLGAGPRRRRTGQTGLPVLADVRLQFALDEGAQARARRSSPLPTRSRFVTAMSSPYVPTLTRSVSEEGVFLHTNPKRQRGRGVPPH